MGRRQRTRRARGWPVKAVGARARAERTWNMAYMVVTLDVSKLSGWLNADAYCRVEGRACDVGRGAAREAGGRWVAATQLVCRGPDSRLGGGRARAERTSNIFCMFVTLDVSKVSGWLNADP